MGILPGDIITADLLVTEVHARFRDTAGGTIATAEAVEATCPITIPSDWAEYDIEVCCSFRWAETGAGTADRTLTFHVKPTNTAGASWGRTIQTAGIASPDNSGMGSLNGYAEGETSTGARNIVFTATASGDNGLFSWHDLNMLVTATRTD
jgi:hypothetical protein